MDARTKEASKDMGDDEETFNVPVPLGQKVGFIYLLTVPSIVYCRVLHNLDHESSETNHDSLF